MFILNQNFLHQIAKTYNIENVEICKNGFSAYRLSTNKRNAVYLVLCDDFTVLSDMDFLLDQILIWDQSLKNGNSYLCVMPLIHAEADLCTYCNGKSFVHFVLYDSETSRLVYDKKFYYSGSKQVKQLIDAYQMCFDLWRQNA